MTKEEKIVSELDGLFRKAQKEQAEGLKHLDNVADALSDDLGLDDELSHRMLQLTLQYRMDKEDVIKKLLKLNAQLCHALGINEKNSLHKSLDIAAQLLGTDNLLRELSLMGNLWGQLNKVLALTEQSKKLQLEEKRLRERILEKINKRLGKDSDAPEKKQKKKMSAKQRALFYGMQDAIGHQEYFKLNVEQLTEAYHQYSGLPKFGLIYDYLSGLKGPISQFHTALQHGIGKSSTMVTGLAKRLQLSHEKMNVKQLLHQTNKSLTEHVLLQKQLLQTQQNEKAYWYQLEARLERKPEPTVKSSKRFDDAMALRRTMNIFNR